MVPLKDAIATERSPLVSLTLMVAGAVYAAVTGEVLLGLAAAVGLWWFGPVVEDSLDRPRFALLAAGGGAVALALGATPVAGIAAAAAGASLVLYPRGTIVGLLLSSIVEYPAPVIALVWVVAVLLLGAAPLALLAAAVVGALAGPLLVRRRRSVQPRVPVY